MSPLYTTIMYSNNDECVIYGISKDLFTFQDLLHDSESMSFRKMQSSMHCLNTLLPPKKTIQITSFEIVILVTFYLGAVFLNVLLIIGVFLHYRYITVVT